MKNNLEEYQKNIFESIKHLDEQGNEYWLARELMYALKYSQWRNFNSIIDKAKVACKASNINALDHFSDVSKTIKMLKGNTRKY